MLEIVILDSSVHGNALGGDVYVLDLFVVQIPVGNVELVVH